MFLVAFVAGYTVSRYMYLLQTVHVPFQNIFMIASGLMLGVYVVPKTSSILTEIKNGTFSASNKPNLKEKGEK
jgi:high-affinity Fe2+/Pb2+ permease